MHAVRVACKEFWKKRPEVNPPNHWSEEHDCHGHTEQHPVQTMLALEEEQQRLHKQQTHGNTLENIRLEKQAPASLLRLVYQLGVIEFGDVEKISDRQDKKKSTDLPDERLAEREIIVQLSSCCDCICKAGRE